NKKISTTTTGGGDGRVNKGSRNPCRTPLPEIGDWQPQYAACCRDNPTQSTRPVASPLRARPPIMSELQRKWAKARAVQPLDTAFDDHQLEDGMAPSAAAAAIPEEHLPEEEETGTVPELPEFADDDSSSASSASSTGTVVPSPRQNLFARPQGVPRGRTLEVIPWTTYFERELFLEVERETSVTFHAYLTSPVGKGPLFVMHHGAGSSGLSFAVVGAEIRKRNPSAGILSLDARGHGSTAVVAA
ncbi:protein phosphatase methylesterase 1, partial [Magnaporthiopsis poae ATCC 64411]